jgi:hypothetical protein
MPEGLGQKLVRQTEKLFNSEERRNFEALWDLIVEYVTPTQKVSFSGSETKGIKKTRRLFDSTAIKANQDLASTIHSTLTNPATRWSKFSYETEDLNNDPEAVAWLESVTNIMHKSFNESNFDTEISRLYLLFPALATGVLFQEEKEEEGVANFRGFQFRAIHLKEVAFSQNHEGKVDRVYRKFPMTARQLAGKFGVENLSEKIKKSLAKNEEEEFKIIHCISPRDPKKVKANSLGLASPEERPVSSIYVEEETHHVIQEGGYYEFPIQVVRWETQPGETYGRGPGLTALPDVRTLNKMKEHALHQQALALRPPIVANHRTLMGNLDLRPGAVSIVKDTDQLKEFITNARFDTAQFTAEELKTSIKEIFMLDKLFLPPREEIGEMTAFEASKRIEQMQRVIGPTIARLTNELLQPLVVRAFKMLLRGGALPEPPAILRGRELEVEVKFINQLARAQQFEDVTNIQTWAQQLGLLAQLNPAAADLIDIDKAGQHIAKIMGIPEAVIADDKAIMAIRQQRAEQAQAQMAMEAASVAADAASKMNPGGGNAQQQ